MPQFDSLDLARPILEALSRKGYDTPTPIQAKAIPPALEGHDVLGCAQTGTGKTAAFALPILHRLSARKSKLGRNRPRALVLSPTRELATQISESFAAYGKGTGLGGTTIFGGVSQHHQVRRLREGVDVVVATPGRLMDLMDQGHVDLSAVEIFVLDEADRMLDMGFINPIRKIAAEIPGSRQTMLFSATMPKTIAALADSLLRNPVKVSVTPVASAAPLIEQTVHMVENHGKTALLQQLLGCETVSRALVFTRTKHGADNLTRKLGQAGVNAEAIHGNKNQNQRQRALDEFRAGRARVLVATDVAARGIDVDGVTHVFNFNLPNEPEAYVHRIGRTGRAGAKGMAVSFCASDERSYLRSIERLTGTRIPNADGSARSEPHQHDGGRPKPQGGAKKKAKRGASSGAKFGEKPAAKAGSAPGQPGRKKRPHRKGPKPGSGGAGGGRHASAKGASDARTGRGAGRG